MITIDSLKSYKDSPDPLILLCLKVIVRKPVDLCRTTMPPEVSDLLVGAFRDYALANRLESFECSRFYKHLKHNYVPLNRIDFSGLPLTEKFFFDFLEEYRGKLNEINISKCINLDKIDMDKLNELIKSNSKNHMTLIIGETFKSMIENSYPHDKSLFDTDLKLRKLVLHNIHSKNVHDEFTINRQLSQFLTPTMSHSLKYLDLSECLIGRGSALMQLESLEILILYDCAMTYPDVITTICHLKKLRVLDLSRLVPIEDDMFEYSENEEDSKLLLCLVRRLPYLKRLDISGTNLVGVKDRFISAFEDRSFKPFEFLGLFHTGGDAAYKIDIPALAIAGEANESQMLNACEAYMDRPGQLTKALIDLHNFYRGTITPNEVFDDIDRALEVVLQIITKHLRHEQVSLNALATLWLIVKINVSSTNFSNAKVRRTIASRILDVMHYHKKNRTILINGGLTLLFLPDIICEYSRVAAISLLMCRDVDSRTQGFGTTLLNTLACQVGGDEKVYIGRLAAIETMIDIINAKIKENICDEILETAWSTLWNITDETPLNCERFLQVHGLEAFEKCMDKFSNNKEVPRNIMGLLGNVAECRSLRCNFMKGHYLRRFHSLLMSNIDGIECSYNACGILAHLISDGQEFWDKHEPLFDPNDEDQITRETIMIGMRQAIERWPINSIRNINYRSFEPIVRLLDTRIAPAAQYWAVFALTNLTRINPAKYCPNLLPHDGLVSLRKLCLNGVTEPHVMNLARIAIYQYERFEAESTLAGLERCDSIDLEVVKNFRVESKNFDGTSEMGELLM